MGCVMKLIPTILCGGAGSRLWPISREQHPKPLIRVDGKQSLLQKAFLRGAELPNVTEVLTVTNRELFFKIEDEYREIAPLVKQKLQTDYILEPFGRNTAPAIAAAALQIAETEGEDAILLILAADHLISDQQAFTKAVMQAAELAQAGKLVTFGIQPTAPETGYGYIESNGNEITHFFEKPSLEKAEQYLASGNFLWNSGMFCFAAGAILRQLEQHSPEILHQTKVCLQHSRESIGKGFRELELNPEQFKLVPDDSIDYAVMEKTDDAAVIACDIGWSDIGCWQALGDLQEVDEDNNRIHGEAIVIDSKGCTIKSEERVVGVVGIENLIVIDTSDALLIANKQRAQDVKQVYSALKNQGHEAHKTHRTVRRPWGAYTILEEGARFKVKRIEVEPGASLSLQMHQHRSEHWVVISGAAQVINGDRTITVRVNESTYIPAGQKHRLTNPGRLPCIIIEVQSGEYLGEDDITRFEDIYNREIESKAE